MPVSSEQTFSGGAPLLSIVTPCYNVDADLLRRCVDSIVGQGIGPADYEILIVDDGSALSPQSLLPSYDASIRYITCAHGGPGAARNAGLDAARGTYVQFVDADDYLFDGVVARYAPVLRHEIYDIVCLDFQTTGSRERTPAGKSLSRRGEEFSSGAEFMSKRNLSGCPWLYVFRRQLANRFHIRFTTGIYHEDEEFNALLYLQAGRLVCLPVVAYAYYRRPGSIIMTKDRRHVDRRLTDFKEVWRRLADKCRADATLSGVQREGLERKVAFLTVDYVINLFRAGASQRVVRRELDDLRSAGLWPLPQRAYSWYYRAFRGLSGTRPGLWLLKKMDQIRSRKDT